MTTPSTVRFPGVGVSLAADVWAPANPTGTVLLLHGGGQTRHSWKTAGAELAAAGRRVVSLDLRGHGDSDWADATRYRLDDHRDDLIAVIEQVGGPVSLVGASLGGIVALVTTAARPELVDRLVLVDIVTRTEPEGVERILAFLNGHAGGFATLAEAADAVAGYLPHRPRPSSPEGLRKNLRQHADGRWYWHWDPAMFASQPHLDDPAYLDRLDAAARSIEQPTLLVQGLRSDLISDEGVEHFRGLLPHVEVVGLRDAAHTAAADDNDAFTAAVTAFLGRDA